MRHYIIAKFKKEVSDEEKRQMLPKIRELFENTLNLEGITAVNVWGNCISRENRFDVMIEITMEESALPSYDACKWHHLWKEEYGPLLESKAIFDRA